MGINRKDLQLLVQLGEQKDLRRHARVIEIGAQQLSNSFLRSADLIQKANAVFGAAHPFSAPDVLPAKFGEGGAELQNARAPFARDFWSGLGFDYTAIDVDDSPGNVRLDLNFDCVPASLRGKFDLVTNLGTSEHVCNQLNAFKIMHDLAAPGAVMMHHLPAGGALNHGLVNYNPKFFWCLARSNDYKWLYMDYYGESESYDLPQNILDSVATYNPARVGLMRGRKTADYAIQIAFQKTLEIEFVPPLDVDSGSATNDEALRRRYWTVFRPELLEALRDHGGGPGEPIDGAGDQYRLISDRIDFLADEVRRAMARSPGRRLTALIGFCSAIIAGAIVAGTMVAARLLHLF